jgi:arginine-tRNA-protein transferase
VTDPRQTADKLALYQSQEHPCPYLADKTAKNLVIDPAAEKSPLLYALLLELGFRRSGEYIYRPHCENCEACIPMRLPVEHFSPRRTQRRIWNKNQQLDVVIQPPQFSAEQYELYCRYQARRHPGGGMGDATAEEYINFLTSSWCNTQFFEFRRDGQLLAVAVTDILPQGL